jgi:hypothetical protein
LLVIVSLETHHSTQAFSVPPHAKTIEEMLHYGHLTLSNLALLPLDGSFVVVFEQSDYSLIAGTPTLIEQAVGKPIADAYHDFAAAAPLGTSNGRYADLEPIAERYAEFAAPTSR